MLFSGLNRYSGSATSSKWKNTLLICPSSDVKPQWATWIEYFQTKKCRFRTVENRECSILVKLSFVVEKFCWRRELEITSAWWTYCHGALQDLEGCGIQHCVCRHGTAESLSSFNVPNTLYAFLADPIYNREAEKGFLLMTSTDNPIKETRLCSETNTALVGGWWSMRCERTFNGLLCWVRFKFGQVASHFSPILSFFSLIPPSHDGRKTLWLPCWVRSVCEV